MRKSESRRTAFESERRPSLLTCLVVVSPWIDDIQYWSPFPQRVQNTENLGNGHGINHFTASHVLFICPKGRETLLTGAGMKRREVQLHTLQSISELHTNGVKDPLRNIEPSPGYPPLAKSGGGAAAVNWGWLH